MPEKSISVHPVSYTHLDVYKRQPLITLQREVCSTFLATALTLEKMLVGLSQDELAEAAALLKDLAEVKQNSKCDALERLVAQFRDKAIIFTEYKASQEYIRYRLEKAGYRTLAFDGSLSRGQKQYVRHLFQKDAQFLVSTESGGEGLNFQFCNLVVNFDLPWNPMRLEPVSYTHLDVYKRQGPAVCWWARPH